MEIHLNVQKWAHHEHGESQMSIERTLLVEIVWFKPTQTVIALFLQEKMHAQCVRECEQTF